MKISEVEAKLKSFREEWGDLEVWIHVDEVYFHDFILKYDKAYNDIDILVK